jgi:hypothetical protein
VGFLPSVFGVDDADDRREQVPAALQRSTATGASTFLVMRIAQLARTSSLRAASAVALVIPQMSCSLAAG